MQAKKIAASAGPKNGHNHPVYEIIKRFDKYVDTVKGIHSYVAWVFDQKPPTPKKGKKAVDPDKWRQFDTPDAIYTTVYQINKTTKYMDIFVWLGYANVYVESRPSIGSPPMPEPQVEPIIFAPAPSLE